MRIIECEQGTDEWFRYRMGMPTASEYDTVLSEGRKKKDGSVERKGRTTYMRKLAGEIITGQPTEPYTNPHMERGKAMEGEARASYAFMKNAKPVQVGFCLDEPNRTGCSPDSLLGEDGGLEIKTCLPHILIEHIELDRPPPEHMAQVQGNMWVTGRKWWDLVLYWPRMPFFCKRIERNEAEIAAIAAGVALFNEELDQLVERIKRYL